MDDIRLEALKEVLKTQGKSGCWDYNEYMMGMYNGMELMMAIIEDRDPVFKSVPDEWLCDMEVGYTETKQGIIEKPKLKVLSGGKHKED